MDIKLKEIKPGMVIHCKTEKEATLLARNSSMGESFYGSLSWDRYEEDTCYSYGSKNDDGHDVWNYCYVQWYKKHGNEITEFEDLIIKDEESEHMDISVEKIEESLRVIREVCTYYSGGLDKPLNCANCPLRSDSDSGCEIDRNTPRRWSLHSDNSNRIFK